MSIFNKTTFVRDKIELYNILKTPFVFRHSINNHMFKIKLWNKLYDSCRLKINMILFLFYNKRIFGLLYKYTVLNANIVLLTNISILIYFERNFIMYFLTSDVINWKFIVSKDIEHEQRCSCIKFIDKNEREDAKMASLSISFYSTTNPNIL